jgi:hypothetical protein
MHTPQHASCESAYTQHDSDPQHDSSAAAAAMAATSLTDGRHAAAALRQRRHALPAFSLATAEG